VKDDQFPRRINRVGLTLANPLFPDKANHTDVR